MDIDDQIDMDFNLIDEPVIRQPRTFGIRKCPFEQDEKSFFSNYRFDKSTARYIIDLVKDQLPEIKSNQGIPISRELQVLVALQFFGRNGYQKDIGK